MRDMRLDMRLERRRLQSLSKSTGEAARELALVPRRRAFCTE